MARNIFWTDSKKLTIEVANLDTKVRKVLFKRDGIFNPRGIAVHPGKGYVYCYFILCSKYKLKVKCKCENINIFIIIFAAKFSGQTGIVLGLKSNGRLWMAHKEVCS